MCVASCSGAAAFARLVLGNLTAPAFAPASSFPDDSPAAEPPERSMILRGGAILTLDEANPAGEALAIRGETILEVGTLNDVKRHYAPGTEIIDLGGHAVLPGFVEPHVRVLESALTAAGIGGESGARLCEREPARAAELTAQALKELARRGCTTVYDPAIGALAGAVEHRLLEELARAPGAPVRVRGAFTPELAAALHATPGGGDERYDVVGISYTADGAIEQLAAALGEPYLNGHGPGALVHEEEQLREALRRWREAGWQLLVRCDGDRAVEQALRCFEAILGEDPLGGDPLGGGPHARGEPHPRGARSDLHARGNPLVRGAHRIDRFAVAKDEQIARAAALGLSVSHPINQIYYCGERFRDELLGPERAAHVHSLRRNLEHGLSFSCHSAGPAGAVDPCLALRTAATRLMRDSDDVLGPFQQLTVEEALRSVTVTPARQALLEGRVGMLRAGMLADLVVLDRDPREVAPERLHELRVVETWLGGRRRRWV